MPRDLTDLMERATSFAPPEPHAAHDVTRLAVRAHRRRTTSFAAGLAVVVVAALGLGYGVTRGRDTTPEPAGQFMYGQELDLSDVVPASGLPGYRLEPWTIPSVQEFGSGQAIPTYESVDSSGRLVVVEGLGSDPQHGPFRARLFAAPGGAAQPLRTPASTSGSGPSSWLPAFYGADRLIWQAALPVAGSQNGFHVTDLRGEHDEFVPATFHVGKRTLVASADDATGRSMWMRGEITSRSSDLTVSDLYRATFSGQVARVGTDVALFDVGSGVAGWVTTRGQVFVQPASGAPPQQVRAPLGPGCHVILQNTSVFAVTGSAVAIAERCGTGRQAAEQLLAFDLSGRALVRISGILPFELSFAGDSLVFQANESVLRYDLVTGSLSRLGPPGPSRVLQGPRGAGGYVLWYDGQGGHVALIPR